MPSRVPSPTPTYTATPSPTSTPTVREVAAERIAEAAEGPPESYADIVDLLVDLWLLDAELGTAAAKRPWIVGQKQADDGDRTPISDLRILVVLNRIALADVGLARVSMSVPWFADGLTNDEYYVVHRLSEIATKDIELARLIGSFSWFTDGSFDAQDASLALVDLERMTSADTELARIVAENWLADGISRHDWFALEALNNLSTRSLGLARRISVLRWLMDDVSPNEAAAVNDLNHLAAFDIEFAKKITDSAWFENRSSFGFDVLRSLNRLTTLDSDVFRELAGQPWFADGLDDAEAAFVVTLYGVASKSPTLYSKLLRFRNTQHKIVSLPLAGDVNIWVIQDAPPPPAEDLLTIIEDTALITERFFGAPFPTTDIILLVIHDESEINAGHAGTHMVLKRFISEVQRIPHETAHYYFHYNIGQFWLREGGPQFVEAYLNEQQGIQSFADRKSELSWACTDFENIRHQDFTSEDLYQGPRRGTRPSFCHYVFGELLLIGIFETIGEKAMLSVLRELYTPYNQESFVRGELERPPTDEEVYLAFLKHAPPDRKEELRDLYRRLHGGAFAFSVSEFSDDHGDDATGATTVSVGRAIDGKLDYMFDFDYFRFHAVEGQLYEMGVDHDSLRDTSITVYEPDGQTQQFEKWKSRWRTPSGPEILWVAPGSGEYYFAVQNFGGERGTYTLTINAIEDAADDHGDNVATATGISLDETVEGTIDSKFDFDIFRFEAMEGRAYRVDVRSGTLERFRWRLYAALSTYPVNRRGSDQYLGRGANRKKKTFEWVAPSPGQYYIAVEGYYNENVGTYTLTITEFDKDLDN